MGKILQVAHGASSWLTAVVIVKEGEIARKELSAIEASQFQSMVDYSVHTSQRSFLSR